VGSQTFQKKRSDVSFHPDAIRPATTRRARSATMRIVFDLNRCLGYAQCIPLAPDVLKLSGEEAVMYNPNPDDSQRQQVLRAVASCPVQAILVDWEDKAEKGAAQ
jgi:ferredoxin